MIRKSKLLIFILFMLLLLINFISVSCNNYAKNNPEQENQFDYINELPKINKNVIKEIEEDPYYDFGAVLPITNKGIMKQRNWREIMDKCEMFEFYSEVMKKSKNVDSINYLISFLSDLRKIYLLKKRKRITSIIKDQLNHDLIDVRLYTADTLFDMGYRKEPYKVYVDIITMDEAKLKDIIENRPLTYDYKMGGFDNNVIKKWRMSPVTHSLFMLIEKYKNKKTKRIIEEVYSRPYIKKLVSRHDEITKELSVNKKLKHKNLSDRIKEYIEK